MLINKSYLDIMYYFCKKKVKKIQKYQKNYLQIKKNRVY